MLLEFPPIRILIGPLHEPLEDGLDRTVHEPGIFRNQTHQFVHIGCRNSIVRRRFARVVSPNLFALGLIVDRIIVLVVVEEAEKIKHISHNAETQLTEPLRIGAIYTISPYLYPKLIPEVMKIAPQMPLIVEENFTHVLKEKLLNGDLDAIFIALPFEGTGIVTKPLYEEPFVVFMRKDHPLSKHKSISHSNLRNEEILLLGENHCFRDQVLEYCPECYTTKGIQSTVEGTSLETLRHMVASGMGITILPSSATQIQHYEKIACTRPFTGKPPQRRVALGWRSSFPRPKAIEILIKAMKKSMLSGICIIPE